MSKKNTISSRRSSRLASIQSVYQIQQTQESPSKVISEFVEYHFLADELCIYFNPDIELFKTIVTKSTAHQEEIYDLAGSYLKDEWTIDRLTMPMRSILLCAIYEIKYELTTPTPVIINEYLELCKFFLEKKDVAFINKILDKVAKDIRI
jgi:N utilization substance protein B